MQPLQLPAFGRVLALGAHADDLEIGCYGTLTKLMRSGAQIDALILSGTEERKQEQAASFAAWGWQGRTGHLSFEDGLFPSQAAEIKAAVRAFASGQVYDLVLVHHRADHHQDHALLGGLAYNLFRSCQIWEYEIPKYDVDTVQPNVFVPLSEAEMAEKVGHLMSHFACQQTKAWYTPGTFEALGRLRGVQANATFAEAFTCRKLAVSI